MKKILAIILGIVIVFTMTACGNSNNKDTNNDATITPTAAENNTTENGRIL